MKQHTTLFSISLGCVLLATSGCMGFPDPLHTASCNEGMLFGSFGGPTTQLIGCAVGETVQYTFGTLRTIEKKAKGLRDDYDPITTEPTVVRWETTYAPLPTPGNTPAQPESTTLPIPSP